MFFGGGSGEYEDFNSRAFDGVQREIDAGKQAIEYALRDLDLDFAGVSENYDHERCVEEEETDKVREAIRACLSRALQEIYDAARAVQDIR